MFVLVISGRHCKKSRIAHEIFALLSKATIEQIIAVLDSGLLVNQIIHGHKVNTFFGTPERFHGLLHSEILRLFTNL